MHGKEEWEEPGLRSTQEEEKLEEGEERI